MPMRVKLFLFAAVLLLAPISGGAQLIPLHYEYGSKSIQQGSDYIDIGLIRLAEIQLIEAVKEYPLSPANDKSVLMQAHIDLLSENFKVANSRLSTFIETRPNSPLVPHAAVQRGYIAFEQKNFEQAETYFAYSEKTAKAEKIARETDDYNIIMHNSLFWKAVCMTKTGEYTEALPALEQCYSEFPEMPLADDAVYLSGQIHEFLRNYAQAADFYERLRKEYPYSNLVVSSGIREANNRLILRQHGSAMLALENIQNILNKISAKNDENKRYPEQDNAANAREEILYLRGEALNIGGNYARALTIFDSFLETFYESKFKNYARLAAGWASLNLDRPEEAIKYYDLVIAETNDDENLGMKAIAQLYRTLALKRSGSREQAQKELSALSLRPAYPFLGLVLLELGQIYYEDGIYDQAARTLERAEREATDAKVSVRTHLLLGATYMERKLWDKAAEEYRKAEQVAMKGNEIFMPRKSLYIAEARLKRGITLVQNHRSAEAIQSLLSYTGLDLSNKQKDEAFFWLGEAYYRSDLLNNAIDSYGKVVDNFPNSPRREESLYGLGWSYFRLKNFSRSSQVFDKLIAEFPKSKFSVEVLARQGDGYYLNKNYSAAAESYRRAAQMAPKTEEGQYAAYQLSHALYRSGRYEQAITSLLDFVRRYSESPYSPNALYLIGWIRFQQGRYNEAIHDFEFLMQAYSQSGLVPRAHYAIGDAYYNMEMYEQAIQAYRVVIQNFPSSDLAPEAVKSVQYAYMALGQDEMAYAVADSFITTNPESPFAEEFRYKKAEMFFTGRNYKDAVTEYQKFLENHPGSPKNPEVMYWMAKSYANINENEKALQAFKGIEEEYPQSEYAPMSYLERGLLYKKTTEIQKADSLFQIVQNKFPEHRTAAQAGFERAILKFSTGDTASAMKIYDEIASKYPDIQYGQQSRYRYAMYLRSKSLNDSAIVEFRKIADADDPLLAAEVQYRVGELLMKLEKFEEAKEAFYEVKNKFAGIEDWYSLSLLNLGEAHERLDEYDKAAETYSVLLELRPEDDFGKTAKTRLKRIEAR